MPTGQYPRYKTSCIRCRKVYAHHKLPNHKCRTPEEDKINLYCNGSRRSIKRVDREGNAIEWRLSVDDLRQLLSEAGITIWDVGVGEGKYQICRTNDLGHYEIGNCRFRLHADNVREMHTWREKTSESALKAWDTRKKRYGKSGGNLSLDTGWTETRADPGGWKNRKRK